MLDGREDAQPAGGLLDLNQDLSLAEYIDDRDLATDRWVENDLMFAKPIRYTRSRTPNVRRDFRLAIRGTRGITPAD